MTLANLLLFFLIQISKSNYHTETTIRNTQKTAQKNSKDSNITYEITDNGATIIYSGTGNVTKEYAIHAYRKKKIIFSEGITSIAPHAFRQVSVPEEGDEDYFEYEEVELPRSLVTIGSWAFVSVTTRLKKFRFVEYKNGHSDGEISQAELNSYYSLRSIGGAALMLNYYLTDVFIPATFESVEDSLFSRVPIKTIRLNSKTEKIGDNAFHFCPELFEIKLPSTVNSIGRCAFANCPKLTRIEWENSVRSFFGSNCFEYSISLEEFTFPPSAELYLSGRFFTGCSSLKKCTMPITLTNVFTGFESMFRDCKNLVNFTLPNNIRKIGAQMFSNTSIETAFLPESVTAVDAAAFYNCEKLKYVNIPFSGDIWFGNNVFFNTPNLLLLVVRGNITQKLGSFMFGGETFCYFGTTNQISSGKVVPNNTKIYVTKEFSEKFETFGITVTYPYGTFYGYPYQIIEDKICNFPDTFLTPSQSLTVSFSPSKSEFISPSKSEFISPSFKQSETDFFESSESPIPSSSDYLISPSNSPSYSPSDESTFTGQNQGQNDNKVFLKAWQIALIALASSVFAGVLCAVGIYFVVRYRNQYLIKINDLPEDNLDDNPE